MWAEQRAYVYKGDDSDTQEFYLWGRFVGSSWDVSLSRDEALARFKEAIILLHLGDVSDEMAGKQPEYFLDGNVGSVACPAPRSQQFLVRR